MLRLGKEGLYQMHLIPNNLIKGAIAIVIWTFIVFIPSLGNNFVNYDDWKYVTENPYIHGLTLENLEKKAQDDTNDGSIFPLPMLSFAAEYHFIKFDPRAYHVDNLELHLINALLVYILIYLLSNSAGIAFLTAMLFAINPLRVESVAWIAERKDLLYAFFYLGSLIMYVYAVKEKAFNGACLACSCALFIFSLLSKPQAITLPFVILAIDLLYRRPRRRSVLIEKAPFLMITMAYFYFLLGPRISHVSLTDPRIGNSIEKIFLSCNAVLIYILKNFIPFHLSCLYPFPHKVNGHFSLMVYGAPMMVLGVGYLLLKFFRENRFVIFGALFFIINIAIPLRLIWYNWFIGEHYMYLPSIGLCFAFSTVIVPVLKQSKPDVCQIGKFLLALYIMCLSVMTFQYCHVWKDDITLWSYAIKKNPNDLRTAFAYWYRGLAYEKRGNHTKALEDYDKAIMIYPDFAEAHASQSEVFHRMRRN